MRGVLVAAVLAVCAALLWIAMTEGHPPATEEPVAATKGPATPAAPARPIAEPASPDDRPTPPPPVDLSTCDRELDLFGEVVDTADAPIAGAALQCVTYPWRRLRASVDLRGRDPVLGPGTVSASDGAFRLRLARGESTTLRASADGFAAIELPLRRAGERVRVVLTCPVTLSVHATDESGANVPGVALRVIAGQGEFERSGVTDGSGRAAWSDVPANCPAMLLGAAAGTIGMARANLVTPTRGETTVELKIQATERLSGRVSDHETGEPVAGAGVSNPIFDGITATSDAEGRFAIEYPKSGQAAPLLCVRAAGYADEWPNVQRTAPLDVRLRRSVSASGRIVNATGAPVANAHVSLTAVAQDAGRSVRSNGYALSGADGRFVVLGLASVVVHTVVVVAEGHACGIFEWSSAAPDAGDLALQRPRRIAGRVIEPDGSPVSNASVWVALRSGRPGVRFEDAGRTDDLGRFAFRDAPPGNHSVSVTAEARATMTEKVEVAPDTDPPELLIRLPAGRRIDVCVCDEAGLPVSGAMVWRLDRTESTAFATDARGIAPVFVETGGLKVRVVPPQRDGRFFETPEPIDLPLSGELTIVLKACGHATGSVVGPGGETAPTAWVETWRYGERLSRVATDDKGRFDIAVPSIGVCSIVYAGVRDVSVTRFRPYLDMAGRIDGVSAGDTDLVLRLSPMASDRTLTVLVLSPEGGSVAGAQVGVGDLRAWTGADGRATLQGLTGRELSVRVFPYDPRPRAARSDWMPPAEVRVVPDGQEMTLRYSDATAIDVAIPAVELKEQVMFRVVALSGTREVASVMRMARPGQEDWRVRLVVPAAERGPFRVEVSNFTGGAKFFGAADGVSIGDGEIRIVVAPK